MRYMIALNAVIRDVEAAVRDQLRPRLPAILAAASLDLSRTDAPADDGEAAMAAVRAELDRTVPEQRVSQIARSVADDTSQHNSKALRGWLKQVVGFEPAPVAENLDTQIEAFVKQNVQLVRGLTDETLGKIEGAVLRGVREGRRVEQVAKEITVALDGAKARAALIANDQVASINGELTRIRHTRLGLDEYVWSTSKDERVRAGHRALEGTTQKWSQPPIVNQRTGKRAHPGGDVRCRCAAVPKVDKLLASLGIEAA
jgi:SPP1 gp7 family putative phage head morphogenesis protein